MNITPDYRCVVCGASGVKLWRKSYTFNEKHGTFGKMREACCAHRPALTRFDLRCASCASTDQGKDISSMRPDGTYHGLYGWTDQIGWFVPAVPSEDGSYWGYTSVPQASVDWWKQLPNLHDQERSR